MNKDEENLNKVEADQDEIEKILKNRKKVIFSPAPNLVETIKVDLGLKTGKIVFTSDTTDYLMSGRLEEVLEEINGNFRISEFKIEIDHEKDRMHNKDITIFIKDKKLAPEIIEFLMNSYYKELDWEYAPWR